MDNQQVTNVDLAWLGGIWDGEGTISLRRSLQKRGNKNPQFSPRVSMVNTNSAILEKVVNILDSLEIKYYFREKDQGGFAGSRRQCFLVSVETLGNAVKLLVAIRPYLVGKRFQCDMLLKFCESRLRKIRNPKGGNHRVEYSAQELEWLDAVIQENGNPRGTSEAIREAANPKKADEMVQLCMKV